MGSTPQTDVYLPPKLSKVHSEPIPTTLPQNSTPSAPTNNTTDRTQTKKGYCQTEVLQPNIPYYNFKNANKSTILVPNPNFPNNVAELACTVGSRQGEVRGAHDYAIAKKIAVKILKQEFPNLTIVSIIDDLGVAGNHKELVYASIRWTELLKRYLGTSSNISKNTSVCPNDITIDQLVGYGLPPQTKIVKDGMIFIGFPISNSDPSSDDPFTEAFLHKKLAIIKQHTQNLTILDHAQDQFNVLRLGIIPEFTYLYPFILMGKHAKFEKFAQLYEEIIHKATSVITNSPYLNHDSWTISKFPHSMAGLGLNCGTQIADIAFWCASDQILDPNPTDQSTALALSNLQQSEPINQLISKIQSGASQNQLNNRLTYLHHEEAFTSFYKPPTVPNNKDSSTTATTPQPSPTSAHHTTETSPTKSSSPSSVTVYDSPSRHMTPEVIPQPNAPSATNRSTPKVSMPTPAAAPQTTKRTIKH